MKAIDIPVQDTPLVEPPPRVRKDTPRVFRIGASILFVAVWVALGFTFHMDANAYLVTGIPLTIFFQVVVKREPLRALWLRKAPPLVASKWLVVAIIGLTPLPAYLLCQAILHHQPASIVLWMAACLAGVFAAAYSLAAFDRTALRAMLMCLATGGLICIAFIALRPLLAALLGYPKSITVSNLLIFGRSALLYFPISFVVEEVSFRGAIDGFVQRRSEGRGWATAFLVSALWGLWHLPIVPHPSIGMAAILIVFQTLLGVPLSIAWRRSGNLAAPAAVHAFVDAVRNMVQAM